MNRTSTGAPSGSASRSGPVGAATDPSGEGESASTLHRCRFCDTPLRDLVLDLGASPLANSYLDADQLERAERHYPLCTYLCSSCHLVQLPAFGDAHEIFSDYAYFSSYSSSWLEHARVYCEEQQRRFALDADSLVIEVASNDGYLLRNFCDARIPVLGIEPARNVAAVAEENGIPTVNRFLGDATAQAIVDGTIDPSRDSSDSAQPFGSSAGANLGREADLVVANNVFAHVPDLNDFTSGLRRLLKPTGVLTIEVQHLLRLLEQCQFDTIYHEHYSYHSLLAARNVLAAHGLVVFDVEELASHGGSMRLFCRRDDAPLDDPQVAARLECTQRVDALLTEERRAGLDRPEAYRDFGQRAAKIKRDLLRFLIECADNGRTVVGYGAPAKGNTLLNFCGVRPDLLAFTVDRSPHKQGLYLPGTRIPIASPDRILDEKPDYVLILPWNLRREIAEQMRAIREWGGRFVVAVPTLEVFDG